jgi:hypothetical protein
MMFMEIITMDSDNHTVLCVSKLESFFMLRQVVHLITTNKMMGKYQQLFTCLLAVERDA